MIRAMAVTSVLLFTASPANAEIIPFSEFTNADRVYLQRGFSSDIVGCLDMVLNSTGTADMYIGLDVEYLPEASVTVFEGESDGSYSCVQNSDYTVRVSSFFMDEEYIICEDFRLCDLGL